MADNKNNTRSCDLYSNFTMLFSHVFIWRMFEKKHFQGRKTETLRVKKKVSEMLSKCLPGLPTTAQVVLALHNQLCCLILLPKSGLGLF